MIDKRSFRTYVPVDPSAEIRVGPLRQPGVPAGAYLLLDRARAVLSDAWLAESAEERFCLAHLGALRVVAAVLADRGRPAAARKRLVSAWVLLDTVAPELKQWSAYFAAGASTRAAVEAGAITAVTMPVADDQLHAAQAFLRIVESSFGLLEVALAS